MHLQGLDIGPDSLKMFQAELQDCKSVIWNGPMGVFEMTAFAQGTFGIAHTLATLSNKVTHLCQLLSSAVGVKLHAMFRIFQLYSGMAECMQRIVTDEVLQPMSPKHICCQGALLQAVHVRGQYPICASIPSHKDTLLSFIAWWLLYQGIHDW